MTQWQTLLSLILTTIALPGAGYVVRRGALRGPNYARDTVAMLARRAAAGSPVLGLLVVLAVFSHSQP